MAVRKPKLSSIYRSNRFTDGQSGEKRKKHPKAAQEHENVGGAFKSLVRVWHFTLTVIHWDWKFCWPTTMIPKSRPSVPPCHGPRDRDRPEQARGHKGD